MMTCAQSRRQQMSLRLAVLVAAAVQMFAVSDASEISAATMSTGAPKSMVLNHMGESDVGEYFPIESHRDVANTTAALSDPVSALNGREQVGLTGVEADHSYPIPVKATTSYVNADSCSETKESSAEIADSRSAADIEDKMTATMENTLDERGNFAVEKGLHLSNHLKQLIQLINKNDSNNVEDRKRVETLTAKWRLMHEKAVQTLRGAFEMLLEATKSTTTTTAGEAQEKLGQVRNLLVELHGNALFPPQSR